MSTVAQPLPECVPAAEEAVRVIHGSRHQVPADRAVLVGVSGIDGSGKGYVGQQLQDRLSALGWQVALIGADPLQNPLTVRLREKRPARHFYDRVFRWNELFDRVVDPLAATRQLDVVVNAIRPDVDEYHPLHLRFEDVDIVVLEGIFLFKRELTWRFDVKVWVECSFATALARAHARNQENQSSEVIERDYRRVYHAAQRLHFELDDPQTQADVIVVNDPLLLAASPARRDSRRAEVTTP